MFLVSYLQGIVACDSRTRVRYLYITRTENVSKGFNCHCHCFANLYTYSFLYTPCCAVLCCSVIHFSLDKIAFMIWKHG